MALSYAYMAHYVCCGEQIYRQSIVTCSAYGELISILPFTRESPNTLFVEGILLLLPPSFKGSEDLLLRELSQVLKEPHLNDLSGSIVRCFAYRQNRLKCGSKCLVYALSPVDFINQTLQATTSLKQLQFI